VLRLGCDLKGRIKKKVNVKPRPETLEQHGASVQHEGKKRGTGQQLAGF